MKLEEALDKLNSGQCPSRLRLGLGSNKFGVEGAQALADALALGKCPSELQLILSGNNITDKTLQKVLDS